MDKNIELLNILDRDGLLAILYVNLISADSLTSADYCDKTIEMLTSFLEALPSTDIKDKDAWHDRFVDGIEIAKKDKKRFENEKQD